MTSTELALNRTLTDILEDELYNIHGEHNTGHTAYHGHSAVVNRNKNVLELPLPLSFDDYMANNDEHSEAATEYNWNRSLLSAVIPLQADCSIRQDTNSQQQHGSHDNRIFNKYADPSLTTTSRQRNTITSKTSPSSCTTPVQKTVSLNSVMKVANPFNMTREQLPFDVRVTSEPSDASDSIYSTQPYDDGMGHDPSYDPKTYWPLQDNTVALNNEDAKMIFDHEFAADEDDLSEDEDDDREYTRDYKDIPMDYVYELPKEKHNLDDRVFNSCNFVDSNMAGVCYKEEEEDGVVNTTSEFAVIDDEDEDDNMIDEDDLYEPSSRNGRKESVVFNTVPSDEREQSNLDSTPPVPVMVKTHSAKANIRQKSSSTVPSSSPSISTRRRTLSSKRNLKSPSPLEHITSESSNGSEIFTCMIVNSITKQPCSAQFSRSYDLTRHQNTIHAKKKAVFRCFECISLLGQEGYQKTFSRLDALTRHIKSKHEDLSLERRQEVTKYARENIGYVVG